jgi:hypothetical protein
MRYRLLILTLFLCAASAHAALRDSLYRIELVGSVLVQATSYDVAPTLLSATDRFTGSSLAGRAIWRPNHLLGIGIQTGYTTFSAEEFGENLPVQQTNVYASLRAIPLQLVLSMSAYGVEVGTGIGIYLLESIWRVNGEQRVNSTATELGVSSWIGYDIEVVERLNFGPELHLHVLSGRGIVALGAGLRVRYDVIRY